MRVYRLEVLFTITDNGTYISLTWRSNLR